MHFQRFTIDDQDSLNTEIETAWIALREARVRGDDKTALHLAASVAGMLITARREAEAKNLLTEALAKVHETEEMELTGWLLQILATANQYLDRRTEANKQFAEALLIARTHNLQELEHYTLHHWGRCLVEDNDIAQARACFTLALEIRENLNDPRQASSRRALEAIKGK